MIRKRTWSVEQLERRLLLAADLGNGVDEQAPLESVIVALKDNVALSRGNMASLVKSHGGQLGHVYQHALNGFSAQLPGAAIEALGNNPNVKRVEADIVMQAFAQTVPTGVDRIDVDLNAAANIDGQDVRVDVDIAVLDSGIDVNHPDLNVVGGKRFSSITTGPPRNRGVIQDDNYDDDNGHGTHVAGTAAALDNDTGVVGVAPGARLWAVKVLDANGSGSLSQIIAGIDWVTANADTIEVANMSLGAQGVSASFHEALKNSVEAGVLYVVAAGNEYRDILGTDFEFGTSDDTIPAVYPEVATISAFADTDGKPGGLGSNTNFADYYGTYGDDTFANFSNFSNDEGPSAGYDSWYLANNKVQSPGLGIDLALPGVDILSTYRGGGYAVSSGTSMAAPHAAGLAALYLADNGLVAENAARDLTGDGIWNASDVYQARQALIDTGKAWTGPEGMAVEAYGDSPDNRLENVGWAGDSAPTPAVEVSPAGGLVTSEDLASDQFAVVLATQPTADVTIAVASNDTTEGTVDVSSLLFTPSNWNVAQTVTVSGVDDAEQDGDVAYGIVVSAASDDMDYDALPPLTVSVTNVDNEVPPTPAIYVSDILFGSRRRERDWQAEFVIRVDSNGNGIADVGDAPAIGASITVTFGGDTFLGTTDSNGHFKTDWIRNMSAGSHYANVVDLALAGYVWNPLDLDSEDDSDGDNYPDELLELS